MVDCWLVPQLWNLPPKAETFPLKCAATPIPYRAHASQAVCEACYDRG